MCAEPLLLLLLWLPSHDVGKVSVLKLPLWALMPQKKNTRIVAFFFCLFVDLLSTREAVRVVFGQQRSIKYRTRKRAGKGLRNLIICYTSLSQCRNQFCLSHCWLMCANLFLSVFLQRWSRCSALSDLFQCCTVLSIRELFLMSNWNLSGCGLSSYPP